MGNVPCLCSGGTCCAIFTSLRYLALLLMSWHRAMKTHYLSPLLFLSCASKVMNTATNYLSRNPMFNSRQLYQYSRLHYELSVCHSSLKQHCEKNLFSQLVVPSTRSNENCGTWKSKALWEFKEGCYTKVGAVCHLLYNQFSQPASDFYLKGEQRLACHSKGSVAIIKFFSIVQKHSKFDKRGLITHCKHIYKHVGVSEMVKAFSGGAMFTLGLSYLSTSQLQGLFVIWMTTTSWKSRGYKGIQVPKCLWKWML